MTDAAAVACDPLWFAHRYDPDEDAVHFLRLARDTHRAATFITDEYLPADAVKLVLRRRDVMAAVRPAPVHFIFHSAFCCSTLLARAFDLPGAAMGLKEPPLLNDLIGWQLRGGTAAALAPVLDETLALLSRPFDAGEAVVIKPSNVVNALAPAMLAMRPGARALLLHAPLRTYLASIAAKEMWGRLWVRDLLVKQLAQGLQRFGMSTRDYLGQTDLQAAAIGWLAQHMLFGEIAAAHPCRVRTLDSETLVARPAEVMAALGHLFDIALDPQAVAAGPAFTRHSKSGAAFSSAARIAELATRNAHADEIDKVAIWAEAVAASANVPLTLPAPLIGRA